MAAKKQIKKDFSKEAMYRKIMPSITAPEDEPEEAEQDVLPPEPEPPQRVPFNIMELIVQSKLLPTMETLGACTCEQCRRDCTALALNALPAVYATDAVQDKAREYRSKNEIKITAAIIRAVQTVMAEPRHGGI